MIHIKPARPNSIWQPSSGLSSKPTRWNCGRTCWRNSTPFFRRDTPRGLVVNMSDVLFATGKYSLRPLAREKFAKLAGIVSGHHPGLRLAVEGYTDRVGSDTYNQQLSEKRSNAVRD